MEEKILVKSEQYDVKKFLKIILIAGLALLILWMALCWIDMSSSVDYAGRYEIYQEHQAAWDCGEYYDATEQCYDCEFIEENPSKFAYEFDCFINWFFSTATHRANITTYFLYVGWIVIVAVLMYFWLRSYEMTVTDKRIYGKVAFGKRVDLPVDSVSATGTISLLKGVAVSTSSGKISFMLLKNADEIYEVLNKLVIERQSKIQSAEPKVVAVAPATDEADMLKKYKGLLDEGIITQEEFDAKKKELLGL